MNGAKGVLLLILIVPLLGFIAGAGAGAQAAADNQVQVDIPEGSLACIPVGLIAFVILSILISGVRDTASDFRLSLDTIMPITNPRDPEPEVERGGSVIAYRYFEMIEGELWSVGKGLIGDNPVTGRDRGSYAGGWNHSDRIPTLKNNSGIYAAKRRDSHILEPYNHDGAILAKVELSGRIVEGEYGYRAQRCRVLEVYGRR